MIYTMKLIPSTAESHPFARAAVKCGFDQKDWIEEEYFFSGSANVYEEGEDGRPRVLYHDAPYQNRMLVRRPARWEACSGNVVVELLNPSAFIDLDRLWVESHRYFMSHGDIYIGVTSKPDVLGALKKFDPVRYGPIHWDNPLPDREPPADGGTFPVLMENETGLLWDMLTDLTALLRGDSPLNPIAGLSGKQKPFLYLAGWSQCGGFMVRYRESFADFLDTPSFDGYLEAGAGSIPAPINTCAPRRPFFSLRPGFSGKIVSREPYIALNTETETPYTWWAGDSTRPGALFRCYECGGSSHDSSYNLTGYYEGDGEKDLAKIGWSLGFEGTEEFPMDYPYEFLFAAAFRSLFTWVREGVPAPASRQLVKSSGGEAVTDLHGNAVGGVRTPFLDLPTCTYSKWCTLKKNGKQHDFFGHVKPFSPEKLKALYGSLSHYEELVTARTDEIIAEGYLLSEDREEIIRTAVGFARERGLK